MARAAEFAAKKTDQQIDKARDMADEHIGQQGAGERGQRG